jgi:hypothetical protein
MNSSTESEYITVTKDSTIEEKIAIIRHSLEGGKIEYLYENVQNRWRDIIHPSWDFESVDYRYKKPVKIRRIPLGPEDFPPGTVVRDIKAKHLVHWVSIVKVSIEAVYHRDGGSGYANLMDDNERSIDGGRTWLPCYKDV